MVVLIDFIRLLYTVSWQRLREGKNIKEQDLVLLRHEALNIIE